MNVLNHTRAPFCAATLLLAGALAACSDAPTGATSESESLLARQVAALGFRADMIEDHGDFVLVEGDIYISKEQLRTVVPLASGDPIAPKFQYRTTNLVSSANVHDVRVDLSGLASQPGWQTAAREALTHWSGITNSNVRMIEGGLADITVATTCTSSNVAAYASFPAGGNVGPTVYVNTCFAYSTSHAQKVHNMVHEFGHTLGFRHSNYTQLGESAGTAGAVHIWNTPTSGNDPGSVMNGGTALNSWAGFSTGDLAATQRLYALPTVYPTVTNSGGDPLISWNPLPEATGYTVRLVIFRYDDGVYQSHSYTTAGTVTGTSFLDTARNYTGVNSCTRYDRDGSTLEYYYEYEVLTAFPNGTSSVRVMAPVVGTICGLAGTFS